MAIYDNIFILFHFKLQRIKIINTSYIYIYQFLILIIFKTNLYNKLRNLYLNYFEENSYVSLSYICYVSFT